MGRTFFIAMSKNFLRLYSLHLFFFGIFTKPFENKTFNEIARKFCSWEAWAFFKSVNSNKEVCEYLFYWDYQLLCLHLCPGTAAWWCMLLRNRHIVLFLLIAPEYFFTSIRTKHITDCQILLCALGCRPSSDIVFLMSKVTQAHSPHESHCPCCFTSLKCDTVYISSAI